MQEPQSEQFYITYIHICLQDDLILRDEVFLVARRLSSLDNAPYDMRRVSVSR